MKLSDVTVEGKDYEISLARLTGVSITDIQGYLSDPYGVAPVFRINTIHFADGTHIWVEGEHDFPFLVYSERRKDLNVPNLDSETIEDLYHQQQVRDGEVEE